MLSGRIIFVAVLCTYDKRRCPMTRIFTSYNRLILIAAMCFLMAGSAMAQCCHHRRGNCGGQAINCRNSGCHPGRFSPQPQGFRPNFNSSVGVPIRWVNVPVPQGYGYGYGNGYGYGPNVRGNAFNNGYGYGHAPRHRQRRNRCSNQSYRW